MRRAASYGMLLAALEARTAALAAYVREDKTAGLADRIAELVQAREELVERTDELVRTRRELVERTDDLVATRGVLVDRTDELVRTREELVGRTEELVQSREPLVVRTYELVHLRKMNLALIAERDSARAELGQATATLARRDEQISAMAASGGAAERALAEAHACIDALNGDLADVRATLIERTARLESALGVVAIAESKPVRWALRAQHRRLLARIRPGARP